MPGSNYVLDGISAMSSKTGTLSADSPTTPSLGDAPTAEPLECRLYSNPSQFEIISVKPVSGARACAWIPAPGCGLSRSSLTFATAFRKVASTAGSVKSEDSKAASTRLSAKSPDWIA